MFVTKAKSPPFERVTFKTLKESSNFTSKHYTRPKIPRWMGEHNHGQTLVTWAE